MREDDDSNCGGWTRCGGTDSLKLIDPTFSRITERQCHTVLFSPLSTLHALFYRYQLIAAAQPSPLAPIVFRSVSPAFLPSCRQSSPPASGRALSNRDRANANPPQYTKQHAHAAEEQPGLKMAASAATEQHCRNAYCNQCSSEIIPAESFTVSFTHR